MPLTYGIAGGDSSEKARMNDVYESFGLSSRSTTQPPMSPSMEIRMRQMGYRRKPDGSWYRPATADTRTPDGNLITNPNPSAGIASVGTGTGAPSAAWDGSSQTLGSMRSSQVNTAPGPSPGSGIKPAGATPAAAAKPAGIGNNPYLAALMGGGDGSTGLAGDYTENQQNAVLTNPGLLGRGVVRQMGGDPNSGYSQVVADDAAAITPLVAFLLSQSGQADPATTLNAVGSTLGARSQAGGGGAIDESIISQIINPQSQAARAMLGLGNGLQVGDASPEDQQNMVNQFLKGAVDTGFNPWMGKGLTGYINRAGESYLEGIAMNGAESANPYIDFLRSQGLASMFGG